MEYRITINTNTIADFARFSDAEEFIIWQSIKYPSVDCRIVGINIHFCAYYKAGKRAR